MFTVVADSCGAALCVRLTGHVTISDLNERAAAMVCESLLSGLDPGSSILIDLTRLRSVEMEAQGVLVFLLQRALRIPGSEVLVAVPTGLRYVLEATFMRRVLRDPRVRTFEQMAAAEIYLWGSGGLRPAGNGR